MNAAKKQKLQLVIQFKGSMALIGRSTAQIHESPKENEWRTLFPWSTATVKKGTQRDFTGCKHHMRG